jgi:hypothetical protein
MVRLLRRQHAMSDWFIALTDAQHPDRGRLDLISLQLDREAPGARCCCLCVTEDNLVRDCEDLAGDFAKMVGTPPARTSSRTSSSA